MGSITASFSASVVGCFNELSYGLYGMLLALYQLSLLWIGECGFVMTSAIGSLDGPYCGLY